MDRTGVAMPLINRRFLVLDGLGRGGMGRVLRAFDRHRERTVAIKTPLDDRAAGPDHPMMDEYRHWACLAHPNVVRVLDLERARHGPLCTGTPFLVLERAPGRPAHHALRPGQTDARTLRRFAREALRALAHVHHAGLVHRDPKPGNLLTAVGPSGEVEVKLTDFGLATATGTREDPGCISGSLPYLAPESIFGGQIDGRTDLYGLGILLHYLTTGTFPFRDTRPAEILRWHLDGRPADPGADRADVSRRWARFVRRLTERAPARRPGCAAEALRMLGCDPGRVEHRTVDRSELAVLRLAVDAVRLGGVRVHVLPAGTSAAALRSEARVLARLHDLAFHEIGDRVSRATGSPLARMVTDLLHAEPVDVATLIRRHRLEHGLPIDSLGGLAIWLRAPGHLVGGDPDTCRVTARGVAALLLEAASRRPRVVTIDARAASDPITIELIGLLEGAERSDPAPRRGSPAVLMLRPSVLSTQTAIRCRKPRHTVEILDDR